MSLVFQQYQKWCRSGPQPSNVSLLLPSRLGKGNPSWNFLWDFFKLMWPTSRKVGLGCPSDKKISKSCSNKIAKDFIICHILFKLCSFNQQISFVSNKTRQMYEKSSVIQLRKMIVVSLRSPIIKCRSVTSTSFEEAPSIIKRLRPLLANVANL